MHLGSQAFLQCSSYDIGVASVVLAAEMLGLPYLFEEEDLSYILEVITIFPLIIFLSREESETLFNSLKSPVTSKSLPLNPQWDRALSVRTVSCSNNLARGQCPSSLQEIATSYLPRLKAKSTCCWRGVAWRKQRLGITKREIPHPTFNRSGIVLRSKSPWISPSRKKSLQEPTPTVQLELPRGASQVQWPKLARLFRKPVSGRTKIWLMLAPFNKAIRISCINLKGTANRNRKKPFNIYKLEKSFSHRKSSQLQLQTARERSQPFKNCLKIVLLRQPPLRQPRIPQIRRSSRKATVQPQILYPTRSLCDDQGPPSVILQANFMIVCTLITLWPPVQQTVWLLWPSQISVGPTAQSLLKGRLGNVVA